MIRVVADASVVIKWVFPFRDDEADSAKAIALIEAYKRGAVDLLQPPHWLAETAAVISRQSPATARRDIGLLYALGVSVADTPELYTVACDVSAVTGQHVFDTLYHAVALLSAERTLVTADERYHRKAGALGAISLLDQFNLS